MQAKNLSIHSLQLAKVLEQPAWLRIAFIKKTKIARARSLQDRKDIKTWTDISKHSLAKINKSYTEHCFAPHPLPEEISERLNEQIKNSRDSLLESLFEQNQIFDLA
jgi:hypothetical protein